MISDEESVFLDEKHHAGLIKVDERYEMFYWLFET